MGETGELTIVLHCVFSSIAVVAVDEEMTGRVISFVALMEGRVERQVSWCNLPEDSPMSESSFIES